MYSSLSISRDCFWKQVLEPHVFEASARAARKASVSLACKITLHTACQEYVTPGLRQRAGQHLRDMKTRAAGQSQVNATASASDRNGHFLSPRLPLPSPFSPDGRKFLSPPRDQRVGSCRCSSPHFGVGMSVRQGMCLGEWETIRKFLSDKGCPGEWKTIKKFLSPPRDQRVGSCRCSSPHFGVGTSARQGMYVSGRVGNYQKVPLRQGVTGRVGNYQKVPLPPS